MEIAAANYAALQALNAGWPPSQLLGSVYKKLFKALGLYTGHSFKVCDVFANGDSACFVPDPMDRNVLVQDGPAKDKDGRVLSDITNRVPGGGGSGMIVRDAPPNLEFGAPGSSGRQGEVWLICDYVGGELISCYYEVLTQ